MLQKQLTKSKIKLNNYKKEIYKKFKEIINNNRLNIKLDYKLKL